MFTKPKIPPQQPTKQHCPSAFGWRINVPPHGQGALVHIHAHNGSQNIAHAMVTVEKREQNGQSHQTTYDFAPKHYTTHILDERGKEKEVAQVRRPQEVLVRPGLGFSTGIAPPYLHSQYVTEKEAQAIHSRAEAVKKENVPFRLFLPEGEKEINKPGLNCVTFANRITNNMLPPVEHSRSPYNGRFFHDPTLMIPARQRQPYADQWYDPNDPSATERADVDERRRQDPTFDPTSYKN